MRNEEMKIIQDEDEIRCGQVDSCGQVVENQVLYLK